MLSGMGFDNIYNLQGGIKAWQGMKATGPIVLNMNMIRGDETPAEMLVFAYGLEKGVQHFYEKMNEQSEDEDLKALFIKLTGIEQRHKKLLFEAWQKIAPTGADQASFDDEVASKSMEGGFDMDDFMKQNAPYLNTVQDVLDLAMMLETQGLDLYLRFADKSANRQTKEVLFGVADEEKAHLIALGRLLEEKI